MNLMKARFLLKRQDFGHIQGECELNINEERLVKKTKDLREEAKWNDIQKVSEDNEHFFFYLSESNVFMIKKTALNMTLQEKGQYKQYIYNSIRDNNIPVK